MASPYGVDRYGRPTGQSQLAQATQKKMPSNPGQVAGASFAGALGSRGNTGVVPPSRQQVQTPTTPSPRPQPRPYTAQELGRGETRDAIIAAIRKYGTGTAALRKAVEAGDPALRGATITGRHGDKLDFGGGNIIDMVRAAGAGGTQLQFMGSPQLKAAWGMGAPSYAQGSAVGAPAMGGAPGTAGQNPFYTAGSLPNTPLQTYNPGQLPQFQRPNDYGLEGRSAQVIDQLLSNPTFDPATVAAMKERQKESALSMGAQLGGNLAQQFASLGRADSGQFLGAQRDLNQRMISDILAGNRDIDIDTTAENRASLERATGLTGDFLNAQAGRATDFYRTGLQGALAQEDLNMRGVDSQNDAIRFALERALAQEGLFQNQGQFGVQNAQLGLEGRRLGEMSRQFNADLNYRYGRDAMANQQWLIDRALSGGF